MPDPVSFADCPVPVREDIASAHRLIWQRLAAPGTWWTGAERIAIAAEVRAARGCTACSERRLALSPEIVVRPHDGASGGVLPDVAVDCVHRIAMDPGRLSRSWLDKALAAGLEDAAWNVRRSSSSPAAWSPSTSVSIERAPTC
jgi:hypothetical protein